MKILLLGSGGREHAIAWKLRQDDPSLELIAAPGNPGIASLGRCVPVSPTDAAAVVALANAERVELVVIGPEAPLAAGIADALRAEGFAVFGPSRVAAQIEASKRFAKELMLDAEVPTAGASWHIDAESARQAIRRNGAPVVVKASGLAAGKGVFVCETEESADLAVSEMLQRGAFGAAGAEILVEEFMSGEELSVFAVTDGTHFVLLVPAQDHKRLLEGDEGPNTGGMGAYAPVSIATPAVLRETCDRIIVPTLAALRARGTPFQGLLYAGVMLTPSGVKVVEFNCRFGDPETQAILPLLESSLLELMVRSSQPGGMAGAPAPSFKPGFATTTVVAVPGYPDSPTVGARVRLPDAPDGTWIFQGGTRRDDEGALVTSGGRVCAVTAVAPTLAEAQAMSAAIADAVDFPDRHYRRDIGWRELQRRAGAT